MLSFIYRLLTRTQKRDEDTLDMLATFEEARADAQSRGRWSYFVFATRELGPAGFAQPDDPQNPMDADCRMRAGWAGPRRRCVLLAARLLYLRSDANDHTTADTGQPYSESGCRL